MVEFRVCSVFSRGNAMYKYNKIMLVVHDDPKMSNYYCNVLNINKLIFRKSFQSLEDNIIMS